MPSNVKGHGPSTVPETSAKVYGDAVHLCIVQYLLLAQCAVSTQHEMTSVSTLAYIAMY